MRRRSSSLQDDLLRTPVEYDQPRRHDHLFLWTVFLLVLVGFSMACWIGSYLVFSRPELPFSYKILRKIKKIDPPAVFKVNAAPTGEFLTAEKLYDRYSTMSGPALRQLNRDLERAYLRNFPVGSGLVPYVTGRFTIMDSYALGPSDFVSSGVVVLAESSDFSKVMIEQLYTSSPADAPLIKRNLQTGQWTSSCGVRSSSPAVLHVAKLPDGHMQLTVVPINYGHYLYTGTSGGLRFASAEPKLNVTAGWPIVRDERLTAASEAYLEYRTRVGGGSLLTRKKEGEKPPPTAIKGGRCLAIVGRDPDPTTGTHAAIGEGQRAAREARPGSKESPACIAGCDRGGVPADVCPVVRAGAAGNAEWIMRQRLLRGSRPWRHRGRCSKAVSGTGLNGGVSLQPFLADVPVVAPASGTFGYGRRSFPHSDVGHVCSRTCSDRPERSRE